MLDHIYVADSNAVAIDGYKESLKESPHHFGASNYRIPIFKVILEVGCWSM